MRYFVAHVLEAEELQVVEALKKDIANRCGVYAALRLPAHVTLIPPFEAGTVSLFTERLRTYAMMNAGFKVPMTGFGHFGDRVWFLDTGSQEKLLEMKRTVTRFGIESGLFATDPDIREPHFHVTLASKDVNPSGFLRVQKFLEGKTVPLPECTMKNIVVFASEKGHWREVMRCNLQPAHE